MQPKFKGVAINGFLNIPWPVLIALVPAIGLSYVTWYQSGDHEARILKLENAQDRRIEQRVKETLELGQKLFNMQREIDVLEWRLGQLENKGGPHE